MKKYFADGSVIEGTPEEIRMYEQTLTCNNVAVVPTNNKNFDWKLVCKHYNLVGTYRQNRNIYNKEYYHFTHHKKYSWEKEVIIKNKRINNKSNFDLTLVNRHYGRKIKSGSKKYNFEYYCFTQYGCYSWEKPFTKSDAMNEIYDKIRPMMLKQDKRDLKWKQFIIDRQSKTKNMSGIDKKYNDAILTYKFFTGKDYIPSKKIATDLEWKEFLEQKKTPCLQSAMAYKKQVMDKH